MRQTYFAVIIFLFVSSFSFAQKMAVEGNQWNRLTFGIFSPGEHTTLFRVNGEVVVDDIPYFQIERTSDTTNMNWQLTSDLIREDNSGKVFFKEGNQDEFLLYDFGILVGDTIFSDFGCSILLQSIDTIFLMNGEARKKFNFEISTNPGVIEYTWIEGVGSNNGPFFYGYCVFDINTYLLCYYKDEELLYSGDSDACFREVTLIQNILPLDINISPNPFTNELHITFGETIIESFQIVDILGRPVLESENVDQLIDTSNLSPGTFILLLMTDDGRVYSEKLVRLD